MGWISEEETPVIRIDKYEKDEKLISTFTIFGVYAEE